MKNSHFKISAVVASMALLVPAAASAKRPDHAGKPDKGEGPATHQYTLALGAILLGSMPP